MAIFQTRVQIISRSTGKSIVAAAAYRAATKLHDERTKRSHDFKNKADLLHSAVLLPAGAPDELADREHLWNAVEAAERRKDAQLARDVEFSLPHELSDALNIELARAIVQELFVDRGMVADLNVHRGEPMPDGSGTKIHAHVLLTLRSVGPEGFGPKVRAWNATALVQEWRELLAVRVNQQLAARGLAARVDHRSYATRGLEIEGRSYDEAQRRNGWMTEQLEIIERNAARIIIEPKVALAVLTEHQSTFTRRELARFVNRHTKDAAQFTAVLARIEAVPDLVRLGRDAKGEERFSSREMVVIERCLQEHATILAMAKRHRLGPSVLRDVTSAPELGKEQRQALAHLLADEGLALLVGFAGSGKSRLLGAARAAWERAGYRVRGAALAGIAAEGLEAGSGIASRTLASWEHAWKQGRELLAKGEVLVIDEAGMIGSRQLERVLATARAAHAKVVLVGDPEQLQAIEAGAAFRALLDRHRPATLAQVQRQRSVWMQAATRDLATGRTAEALRRYAGAGMIHASATREHAQERLVAQWDFDRLERPARAQLMLAYTRADVRVLNELARERMRDSGHLGEDRDVRTERGPRRMAVGDRVLFLRNERSLKVKNGTLGELRSLRGNVLEVQLDEAGRRGAGALIQFDLRDYANLDHGYATTIHKSQGTTVGRSYVLASAPMDRHATYVALSRHTGRADLHYGRDEFLDEDRLAARLSRERAKDTTLDYAQEEPPKARGHEEQQGGPQERQVAAQDHAGTPGSAGRDLADARQQSSLTLENSRSDRRADADQREAGLVESRSRDNAFDGDRTHGAALDQRTRAAVQRAKERLRSERGSAQQGRLPSRLAQALVQVRDLFQGSTQRSRDGQGRGR